MSPAGRARDLAPAPSDAMHAVAWLVPLAAWRDCWAGLEHPVGEGQRRRCAGLRDPELRRDRLIAHGLHRALLADALGLPAMEVPLFNAPGGQPRLACAGWHTSLSHTRGFAAMAVARGPVGVDIEARPRQPLRPLADLICDAAEFAGLPAEDPAAEQALWTLWVRKEAALKAAGLGLSRPMTSFTALPRLSLQHEDGSRLDLRIHQLEAGLHLRVALATTVGAKVDWHWHRPAGADPLPWDQRGTSFGRGAAT
jgi:phosphopantetheinyl transferase